MPNTIAHFAVQGAVTHGAVSAPDPRWILLGCVLPDVPWILQTLARMIGVPVDPYSLRLYFVVQASLVFTLLLCGTVALLASHPARAFLILALGALAHLALDAAQTKWANGVHVLAPFDWEMINLGLFWPEEWPTFVLTAAGVGYFAYVIRRCGRRPVPLAVPRLRASLAAAVLVGGYLLLPPAFLGGPYAEDDHSVRTLKEREARVGRPVAFDRGTHRSGPEGRFVRSLAGEWIRLEDAPPVENEGADVSIRGEFVGPGTVSVRRLHEHPPGIRDALSVVGLALVLLAWGLPLAWPGERKTVDGTPRGRVG